MGGKGVLLSPGVFAPRTKVMVTMIRGRHFEVGTEAEQWYDQGSAAWDRRRGWAELLQLGAGGQSDGQHGRKQLPVHRGPSTLQEAEGPRR